ncbi:hypothetical protein [Burkholderia cenocepacia]|uniref:hypothetical protein n=1 Tax=Burkholderia cenocepacia TaxID=95486 RepID=UPI002AB0CC43|nr:hypothetical protein [Burkholderia cenocepacia]
MENEETIEAQSARTPKRCWTESNSAFSFACTDSLDGASARVTANFRVCIRTASFRASPHSPVFPFPAIRSQTMRNPAQALRAYPVGVREMRPLHLAFADRAVGKIGRQFSYKHNAEEGVRLDEQRSTVDRGSRGDGRRSFVVVGADGHRGIPEPFRGLYARRCASAGRCARIRFCIRIRFRIHTRMSSRLLDVSSLAVRADHRCARNELPHAFSFLRLLHPDDTAAAHRDGRTAVSIGARGMGAAFHGKTSMGADGRDN